MIEPAASQFPINKTYDNFFVAARIVFPSLPCVREYISKVVSTTCSLPVHGEKQDFRVDAAF